MIERLIMFKSREEKIRDFVGSRYGLFIHYGLYCLLRRGEWCLNKELIDLAEYKQLANSFKAENFDADKICALAKASGMSYICLTTMHLYHSLNHWTCNPSYSVAGESDESPQNIPWQLAG